MSILDTFQKSFDKLKGEYTEYKDYHDTMITIIPSILELLDSLFLEENVKNLQNYNLLKEDYLDVIKRTLEPDNYKDVKFEAELPDVYDAPRSRREKAKKITKLKGQKVTSLPAKVNIPERVIKLQGKEVETIEPDEPKIEMENPSNKILEDSKVDKALKAYAEEGKRFYKSPLNCEKQRDSDQLSQETAIPDRVLIELPDSTKAYLYNDGKITDLRLTREIGRISADGVVTLNNAEFGRINLVDRDENKFLTLTNNFGKVLV